MRRETKLEEASRRALLSFVVPLWIGAGLADWACHRRSDIEHTAGTREAAIHALMMTEAGIPSLLGLLVEVNAGVLATAYSLLGAHQDRGQEWDEAELLLLQGLRRHGFRDAFRDLHGYGQREISWGWQRWKGGYRLDHLLVSGLTVEACHYEHRWRAEGLSDHSALMARLERNRRR
ncbi:MAG: hypothetical protein E6G62_11125 [Actinobacteria bacterium]|nr:MAG: hypothetical protein E6G62_11125 [Actinomycetota bacterium]